MLRSDAFKIGLGTYDEEVGPEAVVNRVLTALDVGYRHIDTAQEYGNETYVGTGIEQSPIPREDVFLATKVDTMNLGYDEVIESTERSTERLGVNYIDLLYVHWPINRYSAEDTLPAFDALVDSNQIHHVGVSNFSIDQVEEAQDVLEAPLFANQVEMHPFLRQENLLNHAQRHGYWLVAYSPLAKAAVFEEPVLNEIADKHGASEAQVSLAWLLGKDNVAAIPKATGEHIQHNFDSCKISLDDDDMARIDAIEREERLLDLEAAPWNQ